MAKFCFLASSALFLIALLHGGRISSAAKTQDGLEEWGYVEVRPKAHMFWWHYKSPNRAQDPSKPWPTILWLQGGPGGSGVGIGNFEEIGPLDTNLNPRNSTWLQIADLLFVDNPVGTGYSFVEDDKLFAKTDAQAANDLTILLQKLSKGKKMLQNGPLYIVAQSYGGRLAVTLALSALKAVEAGKLKLKLGGVALGNSWISPEDFVFSWAPLLKDLSRLDINGVKKASRLAIKIRQQIRNGQYVNATDTWAKLEKVIMDNSNNVDFYNFLLDAEEETAITTKGYQLAFKREVRYLRSLPNGGEVDLDVLMNGVIKDKLKIIPPNVTWGGQSDKVFDSMAGDFMKPRINEVDELLAKGVNVTVYSGQIDLICATKGAEAWVNKLKWEGLGNFLRKERTPLFCGTDKSTKGFTKSYKNLHFYWIFGAGHFVPKEQPCTASGMVGAITQSASQTNTTKDDEVV